MNDFDPPLTNQKWTHSSLYHSQDCRFGLNIVDCTATKTSEQFD